MSVRFTKSMRKHLDRVHNLEAKKLAEKVDRPLSALDKQAQELGVYSEEFHLLTRKQRSQIVSKAYSAAKSAE